VIIMENSRQFFRAYVVILDYGFGNIKSIARVLDQIGCSWLCTNDPEYIKVATHIILPGVGHAGVAMSNLKSLECYDVFYDAVFMRKIPVLGICLGMQIMTKFTEEGFSNCLGWFPSSTIHLRLTNSKLKVPNIGWHILNLRSADPILSGIDLNNSPFYFCHRYAIDADLRDSVVADFSYGDNYVAVIRKENIIGVQFHPEKSKAQGLKFFRNFLDCEALSVSA
jgi:imidazole glycerol-phosphate synthase subunit HisH